MAVTKQQITARKCAKCPTIINATPNALYCPACKIETRKAQNAASSSYRREQRRQRAAMQIRVPDKKIIITNEEQKLIDRAIDNKYSIDQTVTHYRPGMPEFSRLAMQYGAAL